MERSVYSEVIEMLASQESLVALERTGMCRFWAGEAMKLIRAFAKEKNVSISIEAREILVNPLLSHTFLRLVADGELPFLIDKVGVEKLHPFTGYEQAAPKHLQNSKKDMLNYYL